MAYKAVAIGLNKRILVDEKDVSSKLSELYQKDPNGDFYVSIYKYSQADKDQFDKTKSLAGFTNLKTSTLVFDFDSKKDVNLAKQDAKTLVARLSDAGFPKDKLQVSFSGNKGIHVQVELNKDYTKKEVDYLTNKFAGDLDTADRQIHDLQRIIRSPMSKHKTSGLYKTPITIEELDLPIEKVKELATSPDDSRWEMAANYMESEPVSLPVTIPNLTEKKKEVIIEAEDLLDFSKNKTGLTHAKYALACGYFEEGERHEAVMILASTYRALGWTLESAYRNVKAAIAQRNSRLGLESTDLQKAEVWREVSAIYDPSWRGGTYDETTNNLLIQTKKRYNIDEKFKENTIVTISELREATEKFLRDLKHNRIYTGLASLDKNLILTKGMMFGALGSPGSGKTSFLNLFMKTTSKNHGPCLYFSMDMSKDLLGTKIIQNYTGYSLEKLEDMILHKTFDKKYLEAYELYVEDYKNVGFCFENGYTIEHISNEIKRYEDRVGSRVSLVGVDYLEKVSGPFSEETANSGFVASSLANLAKKHDTCIGLLLQPSKASGSPADEFKSYRSIKGASKIEQDARAIIGIWRPGYDPEEYMRDRYMSIAILKQNMGKLGRFDYAWDGARGSIEEMTSEERIKFKSFLEELENQKKEDDLL